MVSGLRVDLETKEIIPEYEGLPQGGENTDGSPSQHHRVHYPMPVPGRDIGRSIED